MSIEINSRDKCFRCNKDVSDSGDRGQVTVAGFFSAASPAFYYSLILCEDCGLKLNRQICKCLFEKG